ncbi:MAG: hypothetical protein FJY82_10830 [Candidatus Aminicenantes bacterium]|nr:hypothetical protein [Candidatus Aminicenantes bacterium]
MSRKSKRFLALAAALILGFSLGPTAQAQGLKLGFKFMGGMGYQIGGDDTASLRGLKALVDDYVAAAGLKLKSNVVPFMNHIALEGDADIIVSLTPRLGVSVGLGYVRGGTIFGSGNVIVLHGSAEEKSVNKVAASAMPLKLGVYYSFGSRFEAEGKRGSYLFGGVGLYSGKYTASEDYSYQAARSTSSLTAKASGLGFYGGLGSENWINPNFAFVIELYGRYAKFGGFKGDWQRTGGGASNSGSGTLYYYEWQDDDGNWYPATDLFDTAPASGGFLRAVREARIDFSAFGFRFGFRVSL